MDITVERMYTCELRIVTMLDIKVHEETRVSLSLSLLSIWRRKKMSSEFGSNYSPLYDNYISISIYHSLLDIFVSRRVPVKILFKESARNLFCFRILKRFYDHFYSR